MKEFVFNKYGLFYDICNWGLNFTVVAFLWSLNHWYTAVILVLFVARLFADFLLRGSLYQESLAQKNEILSLLQKMSPDQTPDANESFDYEDFEEQDDAGFEIVPDKKDDGKKVH